MKYGHSRESYNSVNDSRKSSIESLRERNGYILGTDIREPMAGREHAYSPYEVPPFFIRSLDERTRHNPGPLVLHQESVMAMHDALITSELTGKVSASVLAYIRNSIHSRMVEQLGLNSHCYTSRLNRDDEGLSRGCRAALMGTATVAQAAEARATFGMVSAPLAEITIIGDKRSEYLDDMYSEVSEYVGHDVSGTVPYRMEVIGFDRDPDIKKTHHLGAMRVMMKRHHGFGPAGVEEKQRSLAIIDLSEKSGIDPEITQAIFEAYAHNKSVANKRELGRITLDTDQDSILAFLKSPHEQCEESRVSYADLPPVKNLLDGLVERDMKSHLVLARNETFYEYDEEIDKKLQDIWRLPITG